MQQLQHLPARPAVQVAGGLVRQDNGRLGGQGSGDSHPLLLPAGQLPGEVAQPLGQAQGFHHGVQILRIRAAAVQVQGQHDILPGGQFGYQVIKLKHKADAAAAQDGALLIAQGVDVPPFQQHGAGGGHVQPAQQMEQGGLAGPRSADNGGEAALLKGEIAPVEGAHLAFPPAINLGQVFRLQNRVHGPSLSFTAQYTLRSLRFGEGAAYGFVSWISSRLQFSVFSTQLRAGRVTTKAVPEAS